ncbi:hypothetical protein PRIPAC_96572 [Pristionchus pacificus]|uniref:Uncharacterized protein n=1 Tax=Pristionchus pacificus TaxID=54126 RepID=A0A2A6D2B9_PRIPA|nr:hypothetical protein PRIPAC_96572 [Pristionchus pacificus]|eukprot:PDM84433.1 hypothetical protein PRIPAC_33456 [Pristionchus pacificus]
MCVQMFTSIFGTVDNSNTISSASPFPIHSLSNEILINIIERLSPEDRKQLAQMDMRMRELEKAAGHRQFDCVELFAENSHVRLSSKSTNGSICEFSNSTPDREISIFFKHSSTRALTILGHLNANTAIMLQNAIKTLEFRTLDIEINDEFTYRQLDRRESMQIEESPHCDITNAYYSDYSDVKFVDDELFLCLLNNSSGDIMIECAKTSITKAAVAQAFQMIFSGQRKGKIVCSPPVTEWAIYTSELDQLHLDFELNVRRLEFTHIKSGAKFNFNQFTRLEMIPPTRRTV